MTLEDVFVTEDCTIKDAITRLEEMRCRIVYVVKNKQLLASVSDGDLRRFMLRDGDINKTVDAIANYQPRSLYFYQADEIHKYFENAEVYSIPLLNYNNEIVAVEFRGGRRIRGDSQLQVPVVIMAGGEGTRLYPYTKILPKALIPIGDLPISELIIDRFIANGSSEFYLICNHKKEMIRSYFDNIKKDCSLNIIDESKPLGTGGGLCLLKEELKSSFFLTNCDIIIDADYAGIYEAHKKHENAITIIAAKYRKKIPYGVIDIDSNNNYIELSEKPEFEYFVNTGMYIVDDIIIHEMPEDKVVNFTDIIEWQKNKGRKVGVYIIEESAYMDMGQLEEMEIMREKLRYN
jgi:dTDP-glucose pyrophosphorylase